MSKLCTWFAQSLGVVLVYTSIRLTQTMYSKKHAPLSHVNLQFAQYPLLQIAYYWLSEFDTALERPTFALVESKVFCPQLNASQQNRRESRSQNQDFVVGFCPFPTPRLVKWKHQNSLVKWSTYDWWQNWTPLTVIKHIIKHQPMVTFPMLMSFPCSQVASSRPWQPGFSSCWQNMGTQSVNISHVSTKLCKTQCWSNT